MEVCCSDIINIHKFQKRFLTTVYLPFHREDIRTANIISDDCTCLVIDRESFKQLIGDLDEIRYRYGDTDTSKQRCYVYFSMKLKKICWLLSTCKLV